MKRIGIVGFGKMGQRRAEAGKALGHHVIPYDPPYEESTWAERLRDKNPDLIIIATPHDQLVRISRQFDGIPLLIEKPGAISLNEALELRDRPNTYVGFSLRYHPALLWMVAHQEWLGALASVRGFYGHGGRHATDASWRGKEDRSGGGVTMDLGVHLIDLVNGMFPGQWNVSAVTLGDVGGEVESVLDLQGTANSPRGGSCVISLMASWYQWPNRFAFEVIGERGGIHVVGLGGSYGSEYVRWTPMERDGQQETVAFRQDNSIRDELADVLAGKGTPYSAAIDALRIIEEIYHDSR